VLFVKIDKASKNITQQRKRDMYSLTSHFTKFLSNIQPYGNRAELAKEIPNQLQEYLKDTDKIKTINPHTRLSGSYSRYTAIKEIKDVDVLLFVDEEYKDGEESVKKVINELVTALKDFPGYLKDGTGYVNADLVLKRQRRSVQVHITLAGKEFDIDVVPSIAANGIDKPLLVPDRDLSKWISSDPLGYGKLLSQLNKDNIDKVVPLIKIFKHWRDIQMKYKRPKSYWFECIVCGNIAVKNLYIEDSSWGELFFSLVNAVYTDYYDLWTNKESVPEIKDPILKNNVAKSWDRDEFETFMRRIEETKDVAEKALKTDSEDKAIKLWQGLFNDNEKDFFPTTVEETLAKSLSG
jgi:hypothetical protein